MTNASPTAVIPLVLLSAIHCAGMDAVQHAPQRFLASRQYDVTDILFNAEGLPQHPEDVDFIAEIEHELGRRIEVPGFWNGGTEYVIRFTPPMAGTWKYRTRSSLQPLDGKAGTLVAARANDGRKGGVLLDNQLPRQFRYANGDSYYPIAFESDWLFALDAENPAGIPVTRKFVDNLASSGFNQVVMNVFAYDVNWEKGRPADG